MALDESLLSKWKEKSKENDYIFPAEGATPYKRDLKNNAFFGDQNPDRGDLVNDTNSSN